jgi:hypothetical protein
MSDFGLVTEGATDQEVISQILYGFFENPDLLITELQPLRDQTDQSQFGGHGGWPHVLSYCGSAKFKEAFQSIRYLIIQIDTDVSEEYEISKKRDGQDLSPEELAEAVRQKLIGIMGEEFYAQVRERLLFAISVHSIECWLLPLYYSDDRKAKTVNCLETLNQRLKKEDFTIDPNSKDLRLYQKIVKPYGKLKELNKHLSANPSLTFFATELDRVDRALLTA